jgi:gluconokinase
MGVSASGKTTVGQALAQRLEWLFADADDYHSAANREKMHDGIALTDEDRGPWLLELHGLLADWDESGINGVLACSALKQEYRAMLTADIEAAELRFVYLHGSRDLIAERAEHRHHAFATPELVDSQFQILEPPEDALQVELGKDEASAKPVEAIIDEIVARLHILTAEQFHADA